MVVGCNIGGERGMARRAPLYVSPVPEAHTLDEWWLASRQAGWPARTHGPSNAASVGRNTVACSSSSLKKAVRLAACVGACKARGTIA